jgi:hypothetical protein
MFALLVTAQLLNCSDEISQRIAALRFQGYEVVGQFDDKTIKSVTLRSTSDEWIEYVGMTATSSYLVEMQLKADGWVKNDAKCSEGTEVRNVFIKYRRLRGKA